jgi:hypothetical protein
MDPARLPGAGRVKPDGAGAITALRSGHTPPQPHPETNDTKTEAMSTTSGTLMSMASTAETPIGMIALADQLRFPRERMPLTERDVSAATGADEGTIAAWLARRTAAAGEQAARLSELIAVCERLEVSTNRDAISDWLNRTVPCWTDARPWPRWRRAAMTRWQGSPRT